MGTGIRGQPKRRTKGDGGSRTELAAICGRMKRRAVPARRKGRGHKDRRRGREGGGSGPRIMSYEEPLKD
jgi:hypothetical protein